MLINQTSARYISKLGQLQSWQQRGILGATAIATQPFIDFKNKDIDEETRKYSAIKTIIKIIVGTGVGVLTRLIGTWGGRKLVNKNIIKPLTEKYLQDSISKDEFAAAVGNVIAVLATVVTAITVDIPVTNKSLNYILSKFSLDKKTTPNSESRGR